MKYLVLFIAFNYINSQCVNFGGKCPQTSPCCKDGWCNIGPAFCGVGCDPQNSFSPKSCYPKHSCSNVFEDFDNYDLVNAKNFTGHPHQAEFVSKFVPDNAVVTNGELILQIKLDNKLNTFNRTQGFGSTVESTRYIKYGKISAKIKTGSANSGIVSAFITKSVEGDEIDFEWVGKSPNVSQTNYYHDGKLDYTNMIPFDLEFDTSESYHIFEIDWKPDSISWSIDGAIKRVLERKDTYDHHFGIHRFPNKPSQVGFGIWDGGRGEEGTMDWAGKTDWNDEQKIYKMYIDWIKIECYQQK